MLRLDSEPFYSDGVVVIGGVVVVADGELHCSCHFPKYTAPNPKQDRRIIRRRRLHHRRHCLLVLLLWALDSKVDSMTLDEEMPEPAPTGLPVVVVAAVCSCHCLLFVSVPLHNKPCRQSKELICDCWESKLSTIRFICFLLGPACSRIFLSWT